MYEVRVVVYNSPVREASNSNEITQWIEVSHSGATIYYYIMTTITGTTETISVSISIF